jgi:hypothetical protein
VKFDESCFIKWPKGDQGISAFTTVMSGCYTNGNQNLLKQSSSTGTQPLRGIKEDMQPLAITEHVLAQGMVAARGRVQARQTPQVRLQLGRLAKGNAVDECFSNGMPALVRMLSQLEPGGLCACS